MDQSKIDMFLAANGKKFNPSQLEQIKDLLRNADDNKFQMALALDIKDPTTMLLISLFAGPLGIDRFMLGETGLGVAKLLTGGGCGIWTIIDWFTIQDKTKDYNFQLFIQALS
jgi:TM2 domain-containing membrane protein YozV